MRCRAALSWRLPERVIRTRPRVLPDHTGILGPLNEWAEANLDVMDRGLPGRALGRDHEDLVDPRAQPTATEGGLGEHLVHRVHLVAGDAVVRRGRARDDPVLRPAIEAAPQVVSGKTVLDPLLDAGAVLREGNRIAVMADKCVD